MDTLRERFVEGMDAKASLTCIHPKIVHAILILHVPHAQTHVIFVLYVDGKKNMMMKDDKKLYNK